MVKLYANLKQLTKYIFVAIFSLTFWSTHLGLTHNTFAVVQLDDSLRPINLPNFQEITDEAINNEANKSQKSEYTATQATILFVGNIVSKALMFVGALAVLFLMIAGGNYILAFGKDERIEAGKLGMFWSVVGIFVVLLSYAGVKGLIEIFLQLDASAT